jgi:atypical dual specificity phosphatase
VGLVFTSPLLIGTALFVTSVALLPLQASAAVGTLCLMGLVMWHHKLPTRILYEMSVSDLIIRDYLTRLFPRWVHQRWWHQITENLYLGGVPLASRGHLQSILNLNVNAVLAILEEQESTLETFFSQPVLPSDWRENQVAYERIACADMHALTPENLNQAVEQLHNWIQAGKTVYLHCKAGRGRSAMVVIGYFIRYKHLPLYDAIQKLRSVRSVVRFQPCQVEALKQFEKTIP